VEITTSGHACSATSLFPALNISEMLSSDEAAPVSKSLGLTTSDSSLQQRDLVKYVRGWDTAMVTIGADWCCDRIDKNQGQQFKQVSHLLREGLSR